MFEDDNDQASEEASDPKRRAEETALRFRMHAELAAVFEGPRKFDAKLSPLDDTIAREVQRTIGLLARSRDGDSPLIAADQYESASAVLMRPETDSLTVGDYHTYRRPGEVIMIRWLSGDDVQTFYDRLQAHFDAALNAFREDERQAKGWKQDSVTTSYLDALDKIQEKMADRYLRSVITQHRVHILTTHTADEINIAYLTETIMGLSAAEVVGNRSAPPAEPSEQDLAWFFKLFSLRGIVKDIERMCFFIFLQKSNDDFEGDEQ